MQGSEDDKPPRRWARRAAVAVAAAVMIGAGVGVGMAVDAQPSEEHDHGGDAESGEAAKIMEWAHKYGEDHKTMTPLPDVANATEQQRQGAADLLKRTEDGTAQYADPKKAEAAGYDLQASVKRIEKNKPQKAKAIERVDKGDHVDKTPTVHVPNKEAKRDGKVLDPSRPETLMYAYEGHGKWKLVGVMYTAKESYPNPPPNPTGPFLRWHYHSHDQAKHGKHKRAAQGNRAGGKHQGAGHGKHKGAGQGKKNNNSLMTHMFFPPDGDLAKAYATTWDEAK